MLHGVEFYNETMLRDPSLVPLSRQHHHALVLCVLIDRHLKNQTPAPAVCNELHRQLAAIVEVELLHHFEVEENILFPVARDVIDSPKVIDDLVTQHREIEELASRIERTSGEPQIILLREFGDLLRKHIRTEEGDLFQEIQDKLSVDQLADIGRKIDETLRKTCPMTGRLPWEEDRQ